MEAATPPVSKHELHHLSDELLLDIAEPLPQRYFLNYRLVCRKLASVGSTILLPSPKLARLYLHPTLVDRFIEICHDKDFSARFETVVLPGTSCGDVSSQPDEDARFAHLLNHPWPHILGATPGRIPSLLGLVRSEHTPIDSCYASLLDAFRKLSNLRTVAHRSEALEPGLSKTPREEIVEHALAQTGHSDRIGQPGQPSLAQARRMVRWSDVEILTTLAVHSRSVIHIDAGIGTTNTLAGGLFDGFRSGLLAPLVRESTSLTATELLSRNVSALSFCFGAYHSYDIRNTFGEHAEVQRQCRGRRCREARNPGDRWCVGLRAVFDTEGHLSSW